MNQDVMVSVIMNCFNGEKYLKTAIDSVLAQTWTNWEIIFWDNQSTDNTAEIVKSYKDKRINYYYSDKHTLLYEARNLAIKFATGDFLCFLDVDDWYLPDKLEKQVLRFSDPEVGIVCGNYWIQNEAKNKRYKFINKKFKKGWALEQLLKDYYVGLLTIMLRRTSFDSMGGAFNPNYHIIGDYDFVIRLSCSWKLDYIEEPIGFYRMHGENETIKCQDRYIRELEEWVVDMTHFNNICTSKNFKYVAYKIIYLKCIYEITRNNNNKAYLLFKKLPINLMKIKLVVIFLLQMYKK